MIIDLSGHRAIVSGSTAGIGFAIATGLAKAGATVVINGRQKQTTDKAVERLSGLVPKPKVEGIASDLGTDAGIDDFLRRAGGADILINNLGIYEPNPFTEITDDDWHRFFDVNVMSGVRLTRRYFPAMLAKNWGRVVFISSESGLNIPAEMIHYGVTKTAQLALARGLAELTAGNRRHREFGPARPHPLGRRRRFRQSHGEGTRHFGSGSRAPLLCRYPPELASQALRHCRRGREHGGLCLFEGGIRHQWRSSSGRWRRCPLYCLNGRLGRRRSRENIHDSLCLLCFLVK